MRVPDFFIVGAGKSGTSAMRAFLGQHPAIFMPPEEIHFFSKDFYCADSPAIRTWEDYLKLFRRSGAYQRVGEKSVSYLRSTVAAEEIKTKCPHTDIIIMLRNPVDMLHSMHRQLLWESQETLEDFEQALAAESGRRRGLDLPEKMLLPAAALFYSEATEYTAQVKRYLDLFGNEKVKIIIWDDFKADTAKIYRETLSFLGVDQDFVPNFGIVNPNKQLRSKRVRRMLRYPPRPLKMLWKKFVPGAVRQAVEDVVNGMNTKYVDRQPMAPDLRRRLQAQFAPEVEALSDLLGRDLSHWSR